MINKYFYDFFNEKIYKKEWEESTDKNIIIEDFELFVSNLSFTDKIRIACFNKYLSLKDLFILDENYNENSFKSTLSRLNKNLDLKVKKIDGVNHYKTSNKGLKILLINTSSFARENNYIKEFIKCELDNNYDTKEIIKTFKEFLSNCLQKKIKEVINDEKNSIEICFNELSQYNYLLTEFLLEHPSDCISLFEITLKESFEIINTINIRIQDLPSSENIKIGDHREKHINKLVSFEGIIRRKSDVKPRLKHIEYLCTNPSCHNSENKMKVPQFEEKLKILKICPKCKSSLELINRELEDSMLLILEQDFTERNSDFDSKKIHVKIDNDLTNEMSYNKLRISNKIKVIGILQAIPKSTKGGSESINYDYILEANSIKFMDDIEDIILSKEDIRKIKAFAKQKEPFNKLINNFLPDTYGNTKIKEALLLQHIGSSFENQRNDSHILLLGDPSTDKTGMIDNSLTYAARHVYSSGTSSSKAGMTAIAIKDDLTGAWVLEPGVLPRANGGMAGLDEMDKINKDDADALTEALEQQRITVNKANISAKLQTKCAFLTGANPKHGKFEDERDITSQINFNPALLSRFDLIFIIKDRYDENKDTNLINHILENYNNIETSFKELDKDFIRKYIYYCRNNIKPILSVEAKEAISKYYVNIRKLTTQTYNLLGFTPRQIKGVIRFASAYAKIHQEEEITLTHIKYAFDLFNYALEKLGMVNIKAIEDAANIKTSNIKLKNEVVD